MTRKKANIKYMENDSARRITFAKRAPELIKKTHEISVLCDVDALAIIYGQDDQNPVVWPSSEAEVKRIISKYKRKPEIDQSQRRLNQQMFLYESVNKAKEKLSRIQKKNREIQMENLATEIMNGRYTLQQVPPNDLKDFLWVTENKLKTFNHRIKVLEAGNNNNNHPPPNPNVNDADNPILNPNQFLGDGVIEGINVFRSQIPQWHMEAGLSQNNHYSSE